MMARTMGSLCLPTADCFFLWILWLSIGLLGMYTLIVYILLKEWYPANTRDKILISNGVGANLTRATSFIAATRGCVFLQCRDTALTSGPLLS